MALRLRLYVLTAFIGLCTAARGQLLIFDSSPTEQQAALWSEIKKALVEPNGREFFELNLRDAVVPGGANGIQLLRGTVISSEPSANPAKLTLAMNGTALPEVLLSLRSPWNGPIPSGTEVEFSGVPESFTREPFLLTFDAVDFAPLPSQKLALAITDPKDSSSLFLILNGDGFLIRYGHSLANLLLSQGERTARQPSALKFSYKLRQDLVSITVGVFFGTFEAAVKRTVVDRLSFETVGTYSARLNDEVVLSDLEKVNLQPLTIKIVRAEPSTPTHPIMISNVPSVQMELASEDQTTYHLLVRNASSQGITALVIDVPRNEGAASSAVQEGDGSHIVIAPGATSEVNFPRTSADLAPLQIVLETVIFQDGTAQGNKDMITALRSNGRR